MTTMAGSNRHTVVGVKNERESCHVPAANQFEHAQCCLINPVCSQFCFELDKVTLFPFLLKNAQQRKGRPPLKQFSDTSVYRLAFSERCAKGKLKVREEGRRSFLDVVVRISAATSIPPVV